MVGLNKAQDTDHTGRGKARLAGAGRRGSRALLLAGAWRHATEMNGLGQALSCPIHSHKDALLPTRTSQPLTVPHHTQRTMDVDGLSSSPPLRHTSLPPSSAPQESPNGRGTPRRPRPVADALALGDEDGSDMPQDDGAPKRRGRTRPNVAVDVPLVKDAVGESVRESFETFLKTYVGHCTS